MLKIMSLLLIAILLGACQSSPPKQYFALSATGTNLTSPETRAVNHMIGVGPISIPEYLQHNKISYWKTPQQLALHENHFWAEPLERGIVRVLALELQTAHPEWRVVQFPWPTNLRPQYSLRIDVLRFDAFNDHTLLEANIDWIDMQDKRVVGSQLIKMRHDSNTNPANIAAAFSILLQKTAQQIQAPPLIINH